LAGVDVRATSSRNATRIGAAVNLPISENADCVEETCRDPHQRALSCHRRLTVAVAVLSYQLYQDRHQPEGVHIELGPGGLSIQGNKSK
jgi:hypothetical protein